MVLFSITFQTLWQGQLNIFKVHLHVLKFYFTTNCAAESTFLKKNYWSKMKSSTSIVTVTGGKGRNRVRPIKWLQYMNILTLAYVDWYTNFEKKRLPVHVLVYI